MGNKTLTDSDIDSDDVWDDLEDDLDILDEEFEEDLDQNTTKEKKKNQKKSNDLPKSKSPKGASSKFLIATTGLAVLSGGAWFTLTNNPDLLSLVMGMTTGEKYFEQTKVDLDKDQSSDQTSQDTLLPTDNISLDAQITPLEAPKNDVSALTESTASPIQSQIIPDLSDSATQKNIAVPDEISPTEDHGFLTPLPTESSQKESSGNQSMALSDLEDNSTPITLDIELPKQESLNEHSKSNDEIIADSIPLDTTNQNSDVKLEENVLLGQTEKSYEEIPNKDLIAPPMPEIVVEEKDSLEILASDTLSNELHKDTTDSIVKAPSADAVLPPTSQSKDPAPNTSTEVPSISASIKTAEQTNPAEDKSKDNTSQDLKQVSDVDKKISETTNVVSDISTSNISPEKPKSENKKTIVAVGKKSDKQNKVLESRVPARKWSLRSASANSAVLLDKSSGNIVSIGVGSHLEGLGKIKVITKENGKWIVKGTKGSIGQ